MWHHRLPVVQRRRRLRESQCPTTIPSWTTPGRYWPPRRSIPFAENNIFIPEHFHGAPADHFGHQQRHLSFTITTGAGGKFRAPHLQIRAPTSYYSGIVLLPDDRLAEHRNRQSAISILERFFAPTSAFEHPRKGNRSAVRPIQSGLQRQTLIAIRWTLGGHRPGPGR